MKRSKGNGVAKLSKRYALVCVFSGLLGCCVAFAQTVSAEHAGQQGVSLRHREVLSDLGRQNENRVAASVEQIRSVLVKNPGLLVELKRSVARDATSDGQMVDDSDLTDQAIFDRLGDDVVFRARATRLLQRFGYLWPDVNPDSEAGKQQELVLKERARRLVQIEAQEDAESLKPSGHNGAQAFEASNSDCGSTQESECKEPSPRRSRRDTETQAEPPGRSLELPDFPNETPQISLPPLMSPMMTASLSGSADSNELLRMAAMNAQKDALADGPSPGDSGQLSNRPRGGTALTEGPSAASRPESPRTPKIDSRTRSRSANWNRENSLEPGPDPSLGPIIRKPNPYSDVPSLYDLYVQALPQERTLRRFAVDTLTTGARESATIPLDIPVGPDYVVGPGDTLAVNLWGGISERLQRVVDREGRISLPDVGPVFVSGRTLGDVQSAVQQTLRMEYRDVSADVSLSRLRTVRVYVVGEVADPGAYDISSLSSALNALVAAGGVAQGGSLRAIKHYRGKQLIEIVDAYDLLLRGVGTDGQRLENGDSLLVPPVGAQITIEGMVRRPAIYELHGETSLESALELAGGILPAAALKHVEVERLVAHEKRTMFSLDLSETGDSSELVAKFGNFQVQDGDRIHIFPIAPYNDQAIYLQGHVLRPGRYSYHDGMTVRDLLSSYRDLLPEPAGNYAEIIRLNPPDFRPTVESFDLAQALASPADAPSLKPLDTVRIFGKYDFQPPPEVAVGGEVRAPGQYTTSGQARLRDAIYLAGGVTSDASLDSAQLFRTTKDGTLKILSVDLREALAGNPADNLLLEPHDRIIIHRNAAKVDPPTVYVKGDVAKPGRYPLTINMRVQDLVRVAGGLTRSADSQNAILTHREEDSSKPPQTESVVIHLTAAMTGKAEENALLNNGDVLTVRQNPGWEDLGATVTVRGQVVHPGTYGIRPGESLSSVLEKAGGFTPEAYPYGIVLTRRTVRDLEMQSRDDLVARVKAEEVQLKALPENDQDQKNMKLTAIAQAETTLTQLQTNLPVGRVVIHSSLGGKTFERAASGTPLCKGDVIIVPPKPNYILVQGQVFNAAAIGFMPGRSANWYLSQAGGLTQLADKKAVFVIRADGSVIAAKNNSSLWAGNPLDAVLMPGDMVVVPEKAAKIGTRDWLPLIQTAQVATSIALAVAYFKP